MPERAKHTLASERAAELGRRSGEARRRAAEEKKQGELVLINPDDFERADLAPLAFATAYDLIGRVRTNKVPVRYASAVASLVKVLVEVGRLESGQHTSAAASVRFVVDDQDRRDKLAQLRAELEASPLIHARSVARVTDGVTQQVSEPGSTHLP